MYNYRVSRCSGTKTGSGLQQGRPLEPSPTLCVWHPVSYSEWLAQEEGGHPCCFKWLHLSFLLFEANLLTLLPADAQFIQVAALLNSKHVASLCRHQGHQVSQRRENVFQTPNPKWLSLFFQAALCKSNPDAPPCRMPAGHHTGHHKGLAGLGS